MEFGDDKARFFYGNERDALKYKELPDEARSTVDTLVQKYKPEIADMMSGEFDLVSGEQGYDIVVKNDIATVEDEQEADKPGSGYKGTVGLHTPKQTKYDKLRTPTKKK